MLHTINLEGQNEAEARALLKRSLACVNESDTVILMNASHAQQLVATYEKRLPKHCYYLEENKTIADQAESQNCINTAQFIEHCTHHSQINNWY